MENFKSLNLEQTLMDSIAVINFKTPTPIQAQSIPIALEGKDILGTAQTGTGKTAAFGIPLVNFLLKTKKDTALIMTPTRELATQVMQTMASLIGKGNIRSALLIGGDSMQKQLKQMKRNPRLIVGTPGRINDHLERRTLNLNTTTFLVLDESDRMLDMGFTPQINQVLRTVPKKHQTLLFSATLANNIVRLAEKYLTNPVRVSVGSTSTPIDKIKQEVVHVKDGDKYNQLIKEIYNREGAILVFVKTRRSAEKMVKRLKYDDHDADAIHGNLRQNKRDRVIKAFRNGHFRILIGTDVASRGLDIPAIKHVINFDLPQVPEDFIHRIGRTARAGAEGSALTFIGGDDRSKWNAIQRLIDPNFKSDRNTGREKRGRGGRSFDRRGSRGSDRFLDRRKSDRKSSFRDRDSKPSGFKRDDRKSSFRDRDSKPSGFKRDDRKSSFRDRDSKPSGFKRDDRKSSFRDRDRDSKPSGFKRDDRKSSFRDRDRDSKPSGFKRDDRKSSFRDRDRDSKPSGFKRDDRKSSFRDRDSKPSGFKRDDRKSSFRDRDSKPSGFKRDDRKSSFRDRDRDSKPSGFKRDDRKSSFRDRDRDSKPSGFKRDDRKSSIRDRDRDSKPSGFKKKPFKKFAKKY